MKTPLILSVCCLTAFAAFAESNPEEIRFFASVYSTNSWKEHNFDEPGMYSFSTSRYDRQLVRQDPDIDASGGGVLTDDFYFCTQEMNFGGWSDITHCIISPDTWTTVSTLRDGDTESVATDLTYDPLTAKIYGCFNSGSGGYVFGTLNEATGKRFKIADLDMPWIACATDRNGNIYAVDMNGLLIAVDKIRGSITELGNLGFSATRRSTGAIDPKTGIFYVVVTNSVENPDPLAGYDLTVSSLYAVDIATATATFVYTFDDGEALGGMFIPGPAAVDGAPAEVSDLTVDFANGSLNGNIGFTVPTTTFDGQPATGEVSYIVRANGALLAEGKATCGEKVVVPAKVAIAGIYDITLELTNAAGRGPKSKISLWLGEDTPENVSDVRLSWSDGVFSLTWNEPEKSRNGGYYDPAKITYSVIRYPGGVTVGEGLTENSITEKVEATDGIETYRYDVVMSYGATSMPAVSSNTWRVGSMPLPYSATFEDENYMDLFTRINCNADHIEWYREWEFYIETTDELIPAAVYPYTSSTSADDWLITPPFRLSAGKKYTVSYTSLTDYAGAAPSLAIYLGTAPEAAAMTQTIEPKTDVTSLLPTKKTVDFETDKDGIYYIGFHACSEPDRSGIALTEIALDSETNSIAQTAPDSVAIAAGAGAVIISGNASYIVYTPDGKTVASGVARGYAKINLAAGMYIVKAGNKVAKIVVL